jgi:hypothetical protein
MVDPNIYRVSPIQGGAGLLPSTVSPYINHKNRHKNRLKKSLLTKYINHISTTQIPWPYREAELLESFHRFQNGEDELSTVKILELMAWHLGRRKQMQL